jgi:hypothetical protein
MRTFAAWSVLVLSMILLCHVGSVLLGGPRMIGHSRSFSPRAVNGDGLVETAALRFGEALVPGLIGGIGVAWSVRDLRRQGRSDEEHR